jgi:hypothetical protein
MLAKRGQAIDKVLEFKVPDSLLVGGMTGRHAGADQACMGRLLLCSLPRRTLARQCGGCGM